MVCCLCDKNNWIRLLFRQNKTRKVQGINSGTNFGNISYGKKNAAPSSKTVQTPIQPLIQWPPYVIVWVVCSILCEVTYFCGDVSKPTCIKITYIQDDFKEIIWRAISTIFRHRFQIILIRYSPGVKHIWELYDVISNTCFTVWEVI
jgi:hypothetical protein